MAERRMFAKTIIDSDAFLDMPLSTQALYFHLSMRADDDGFINSPKKIQRAVGCGDDDLKLLIAKRFIIPFESGIVVIKHWRVHNYIRSDRYKPTVYVEEKEMLEIKDNNAYTERTNLGIPNGYQMDTQVRLGKDSIGKVRLEVGEVSTDADTDNDEEIVDNSVDNSPLEYLCGTLGKGVVLLTEVQKETLLDELGLDGFNHYVSKLADFIISKKATVKNHYATIRKWAKEDTKI